MAFNQQNVNYAATYAEALSNAYPYISYFDDIWNSKNSQKYKPGSGSTVYISSVETSGSSATDRDSIDGSFSRNWNNNLQAVSLEMDREWTTLIDPMDVEEAPTIEMIGNITKSFNEQQKIPEMDAYLASKLYSFATPDTASLTASNFLAKWDGWLAQLQNNRCNMQNVVCYMTPATFSILKSCSGMTRYFHIDGEGGGNGLNVNRTIATMDGVRIRTVPTDIMKSSFVFTEGWAAASGAKQIHLIMVDEDAIAAPVKYSTCMLSEPSAQTKGKWLYYERYYYGAFKLNQRADGIIVVAAS